MLSPKVIATLMLLAVVASTMASNRLEVPEAKRVRRAPSTKKLENKGELEQLRGKRSADEASVKLNDRRKRDLIDLDLLYCPSASGELCCKNTVFRGQFDFLAQCCGNDVYDVLTARCCNDQIKLTSDDSFQCCGDDLYNVNSQMCCNGKAYDLQRNQLCCDTGTYDVRKQICCNGILADIDSQVLSCCGPKPYQPAVSHCINNEIKDSSNPGAVTQVCGTDQIDFKKQICCEGKPLDRPDDPTAVCCGAATVSAATQLCCNGSIVANPPDDAQCCFQTAFDPNKEVCCNGKVYPRPENSVGTGPYCSSLLVSDPISFSYTPYFDCCGQQLLTDLTTQLCCGDQLYSYRTPEEMSDYSCCASKAYNCSEQICCQDTLSSATYSRCCGNAPYDLNANFCCGDTVYKHNEVPADKCCGFYQPYETIIYVD